MEKGDKLYCIETVNNVMGYPLFEKGKIYTVLNVEEYEYEEETGCCERTCTGLSITLNHNLYANEYADYELEWVNQYFVTLKEARRLKLNEISKK